MFQRRASEGNARGDGGPLVRSDGGLFDASPDPTVRYVLTDGERRVTDTNGAFRRAFDPGEAVSGRRLEDVLITGGAVTGRETAELNDSIVPHPDEASDRTFLARVVPPEDGPGYVIYTDVTAQRERIRELEAQVDRLDDFADVVAHDLRNPLEVASIRLEAAQASGEAEHFEKAESALDRIERLVDRLLDSARTGSGIEETEKLDLDAVVRKAWEGVDTGEADLRTPEDLGEVDADPENLQRLLENLFRNAIEHGSPEEASPVEVTVGRLDGGFFVADDGPGIPPEDREGVFVAGFSTRTENTGLGLAIVEGIAEGHGWDVTVTDAESGGARFEIITRSGRST
ncbi:MAG: ATP-binding protein [Halobacteriales archaeon]